MSEDRNTEELKNEEILNEAAERDIKETAKNDTESTAADEDAGKVASKDTESTQNSSDEAEVSDAEEEKTSVKKDKKDEKIEELTDKYMRLFAEFDNFRKRTELEKSGMYAEGEKAVLLKVLDIVDNFERALSNVPEELKGSSYVEGMDKIYRSTLDTLKGLGTEPIEALGKEFDANYHNAVMHVEDESVGENIIVDEFQKGYMFRDKVLRYSMVKVAN